MSYPKPIPSFTFDVLCYLNRDQLERFSIVCRQMKNLMERYFHSKPNRVFNKLNIRAGKYALYHNGIQWHPNREDYSVQHFLASQRHNDVDTYYSFPEMRPYLGPTVRIKYVALVVTGPYTYNPQHISEMESIAYLWRDHKISVQNYRNDASQVDDEEFQLILNSPIILQSRVLEMINLSFSFKDYKILYAVKVIQSCCSREDDIDLWQQFQEQPGDKPVVVFFRIRRKDKLLDRLSKAFSTAVSPNAFKIVFARLDAPLTEFREANKVSGEIMELKKGFPVEYEDKYSVGYYPYTLERSNI